MVLRFLGIRTFFSIHGNYGVHMLFTFLLAFGAGTAFSPPLDIHIPGSDEIAEMIVEEYGFEEHSMVEKDPDECTNEEYEGYLD